MIRTLLAWVILAAAPGFTQDPGIPIPSDHWWSRAVDVRKGMVDYYETYIVIENGVEVNKRVLRTSMPLPAGYREGDFAAALSVPAEGHTLATGPSEDGGVATWEQYHVYNAYGIRRVRQKLLLIEPAPKPAPKPEPQLEEITDPMLELLPEPKAESVRGAGRGRSKLLPPSRLGRAPVVGEEFTQPKKAEPAAVGPETLLRHVPPAASSVNWAKGSEPLSTHRRAQFVEALTTLGSEAGRWQFDLSKRFLTCTEGKCLIRQNGDELVELPFQVGLGRIWLLRLETERLVYDLKQGKLTDNEEKTQLLQVLRRLESLDAQLKAFQAENPGAYVEQIGRDADTLRELVQDWAPSLTPERKQWMLRWQMLAKDAQVLSERASGLKTRVPQLAGLLEKTARQLNGILKGISDKPWEGSDEAQYEAARRIYFEATADLREKYREVARVADSLRSEPQDYVDLLVVMGAAENTGVYSWTIMDELSQPEENKE